MNDIFPRFDWRDHWLFVLGFIICVYFGYHLMYGPRSFPYLQQVQERNIILDQKLTSLSEKEDELESKVIKLRPETLDTDLLKERARTMLGYTDEKEIIIIED